MTKELRYLVFAIEYYRHEKGLTGAQVADLFEKNGIYQIVLDNYFLYHIESPEHMVHEIDHYLETGSLIHAM
ncbi:MULTISPECIES: DUF3791 domain-containing protein [unclassified Adlercreutzia]|uniref:DUF3791 domain-containing protein n=1 Tax=unclassified Adlercreutzia TaxID=2636013 RepID=UPI0013EDF002|nr:MULTISPECIES: DUF3791 domain-containing protein [unclassified Adlercreutzia]